MRRKTETKRDNWQTDQQTDRNKETKREIDIYI